MATTYVRIVPVTKNTYQIKKGMCFAKKTMNGEPLWLEDGDYFRYPEAKQWVNQQGWLILPEAPKGFAVIFDQGVIKFCVMAKKQGKTSQWLNQMMTGWTTDTYFAVTLPWEIAQAISDTYK